MVKVKGYFKDIKGTERILKRRQEEIASASSIPVSHDSIKNLANKLHPKRVYLTIDEIIDETPTTRTFRLVRSNSSEDNPEIPIFQAGQYISFKINTKDSFTTRPYTISSAPCDALSKNPYLEVTIKRKKGGFGTKYIWNNWKEGIEVEASMPHGNFYYEPLRDKENIVTLAGGSGITPFRSMAREIIYGKLNANLTILYGSKVKDDIIFYKELEELANKFPEKIKVINVLSHEEDWEGEKGFITKDIIEKYADIENSSFFVCGPEAMYNFIDNEISKLDIPPRRYRKEVNGQADNIYSREDFPKEAVDMTYKIKVNVGIDSIEVPAYSSESIIVALEKANFKIDSNCRSGECGFCRSELINGEIYVDKKNDGRRKADIEYGYFHPCSSYPISDLEIKINP